MREGITVFTGLTPGFGLDQDPQAKGYGAAYPKLLDQATTTKGTKR